MYCWGNAVNGELGLGGIEDDRILSPRELSFGGGLECNVLQVGCGQDHTAILCDDGTLFTCGCNDCGQLGHDKSRKRPERVDTLNSRVITKVDCGSGHTLAVDEWGQIFSWGRNAVGQLGLESVHEDVMPTPKIVRSLATRRAVQVACGANHSLALLDDGELYSWGCNGYGQLGLGAETKREPSPRLVTALAAVPIKRIVCGGNHSFALSAAGGVFAWGRNNCGQLGLNDCKDRNLPSLLKTLRSQRVRLLACGEDHTAALTQDGGVFTFGAGTYGQLGHGVKSNEIVPRKVLELMGTEITQIACGRRHTLALEPRRYRLYAFGLGGSGQLGLGNAVNTHVPARVPGPWEAGRPKTKTIKRIFCGGHQSFVTVAAFNENEPPVDYRQTPRGDEILTLDVRYAEECARVHATEQVPQELMSYVETVFGSAACVNGSFVDGSVDSLGCSGRDVALDRTLARTFFRTLAKVTNPVILDLIASCVSNQLISRLACGPTDAEALRLYVVLPMCHVFDLVPHFGDVLVPFGNALLKLRNEAAKIIDSWWNRLEICDFSRLISMYKKYVVSAIARERHMAEVSTKHGLHVSLRVLEKLNRVNHDRLEEVPYEAFYIPELTEKVDVRVDYLHWLQYDTSSRKGEPFFCNYPFVFDAQAKTILMQTDTVLQMQNAMDQVYRQNIMSFFLPVDPSNPYLVLHVSRENLVRDTLNQLEKKDKADLKKPLKVTFYGEDAVDAGGVRKEFFMLLLRDIIDPKYGMFKLYEETNCIWFNEKTFEEDLLFRLIGILCGLAIYNGNIINLPFPLALYKKLLNEELKLDDLRGLSPSTAKSLREMLQYEDDDFEDVFMLKFEASIETFSEVTTYQLKQNGANISVTKENREEYVNLYVDLLLNKLVEKPYMEFHNGFHKVCGGQVLGLFHAQELMAMIVGNEHYDWQELEDDTEYKGEFGKHHPTIRMFWEVFHELTVEQKKQFLLFLTGYDRIPIFGMKSVKLTIQSAGSDENFLPVAHTCFNLLDLPRYKSKTKLREKLLQAIKHCQGFALA